MTGTARGYGVRMSVTGARPRPIRVTLAHECELVARGVAQLLAPYSARVTLVPAGDDGTPATDVDLTLHDPLVGAQHVSDVGPLAIPHHGRLVIYTWNPRPALVDAAMRCGASGCLAKALPAAELVAALEAIHRGDEVLECGASRRRGRPVHPEVELTPREAEIVALITRGFDNFAVAREASLSINSVKTYIRTAYRKMGVTSRSQAVLWGVRHGYLRASEPDDTALTG